MKAVKFRANVLQIISILMAACLVAAVIVMLSGSSASSKAMSEVSPSVTALFENDRSELSTDRIFKKYYGLNAADYDAVVLYFPLTNMDAEELLIIRLRDESQAEEVRSAIEERQKTQIGIYEGYAPEQLALCENAIIDVQGNYILYVVHKNAAAVDEAFREAVKD